MEIWFAIATGVISGVVSAGILFVARTLIVGHLLPWYHDLVYRGINIDGKWFASNFEMAQDISIEIKQRAGAITGNAQFSKRGAENHTDIEDSRTFDVTGRIQDRYITLTLTHKNRQRIGVVSFLLEPICDGRQLQGIMSFVSIRDNHLDSLPMHFARDASIVISACKEAQEEFNSRLEEAVRSTNSSKQRRNPKEVSADLPPEDEPDKVIIE